MFGHDWQKATGTIVDSRIESSSGLTAVWEYVIDVRMADGRTFRARVEQPHIATDFWEPGRGDVVGVEVDAKNGHVRFDKSDPQLSAKAHKKASMAAFDVEMTQAPGTPLTAADPAAPHLRTPEETAAFHAKIAESTAEIERMGALLQAKIDRRKAG